MSKGFLNEGALRKYPGEKISDIIIMVDPTRVKEDDDDRDVFNYWFFVT